MATGEEPTKLIRLFYFYSHRDEDLRRKLQEHLAVLKWNGMIAEWNDRDIEASADWETEIDRHLSSADIILLLISASFIASPYCWSVEVKKALERHARGEARVIPVILRPCQWDITPFAHLQATPRDARPVTAWPDLDTAFNDVANMIKAVVLKLQGKHALSPAANLAWNAGSNHGTDIGFGDNFKRPKICNLLPKNRNFTGREKQLQKIQAVLTGDRSAAVTGWGGIGKTQLALEYAHCHAANYDIIWWVEADTKATLTANFLRLAAKAQLPEAKERKQQAVVDRVLRWLEEEERGSWLLVFDNADAPDTVRPFLPRRDAGHLLITSRHPDWQEDAACLSLETLSRPESIAFLKKRTERDDPVAADELAAELGDLPLALEQAGAYIVTHGETLGGYLTLFRTRRLELLVA